MCGIAGGIRLTGARAVDPDALRRMLGVLEHRGPDSAGMIHDGPVALGHARLSIVDLAGGAQPIPNEDGTQWIVANGEAFNYVELGERLRRAGHRFRSRSDTEVMLHLYEERGLDFVADLNGQYAFAIWDAAQQQLVLGRDRLGVRPLFYTVVDGALLFASEIKALLADPRVPRRVDLRGLDDVFTYWSVLPGRTMFEGIAEVPAGCLLVLRPGSPQPELVRYWSPEFPGPSPQQGELTADEAASALRDRLTEATRLRLRADVPVAAYLSGGLDSTAITALAGTLHPGRLQTFSVTFDDQTFDESDHQLRAARFIGTDHHVVHCRSRDIADVFPDVVRHAETPLLRTAPAPLFLLSALVRREGYRAVLTGEGADEFLAGYNIFKESLVRRFWARDPASTLRPLLLRRMYDWLPGLSAAPQAYLEAFFRQELLETDDPAYSHRLRWRSARRLQRLFSPAVLDALGDGDSSTELDRVLGPGIRAETPLAQAQHVEVATFLTPYLLSSQGDRMAMAHSVEGRFPFLDRDVVDFARRLPSRVLMPGLAEKDLLKRAVADLVPPEIITRPKQPYRAPIAGAFCGPDAPGWVDDALSADNVAEAGLFAPEAVARLVAKCRSGRPLGEHDEMALVGVLSTQLWYASFIRSSSRPPQRADVVSIQPPQPLVTEHPVGAARTAAFRSPPPSARSGGAITSEHLQHIEEISMGPSNPVDEGVRRQIHDYVVDNFLFGVGSLDDSVSLIEEGILDSTGVLEMVLFVEEQLGIRVADAEVLPDNFGSVDALTSFVARRTAVVPQPAA